ncbi:MAG TPA: SDR family NAD(P)-dependent oxidoreductase [Stellaceae bacterium]|nr:SDR family NAD(P)-dependent oxidoreductase [Stellaceae bacterium]
MVMRSDPSTMVGKNVLITGANSGLGFASARALAALGATIIMACRNESRGIAARDEIAKIARGAPPVLLVCDLSLQAAVQTLAKEVHARTERLDVLMNNAGAIFARRELTADGIEKTFAVNHLAPFLLTNLLLDRLRAAPAGRVVNVVADPFITTLDFDNLQSEKGHNFLAAYFRSKLANILFTYEFARLLAGTSVTANCASPGPALTNFGANLRGMPALFHLILAPIKRIPFLFYGAEKGAETQVYLASSPEVANLSGRYFFRGREKSTKAATHDPQVAARLWEISEELCSTRAPLPRSMARGS